MKISDHRSRSKEVSNLMCLSEGCRQWGQAGSALTLCPGTEKFYSLDKIKQRTELREPWDGGEGFTGSWPVENTREATAGCRE